jgi:N-acetylglucosaminyl-diphospho-decaprenol L-rhamnosyltransferase
MIYVLIPVFNRLRLTQSCIESISNNEIDTGLKIIIVDDGSSDGTTEWVQTNYPEVTILQGTGSLYWGGAIHYGVEYILKNCNPNDYVLLVNNDVLLADNTISELVNFCEQENRKAVIGSISIDSNNGRAIKSGTKVKSWLLNRTSHIFLGQKIENVLNQESMEVDLLTGRCLLHPVEVFLKAGNYDANSFRHYGADDEFSMRVKRFGYKTYVCTSAIVYMQQTSSNNLGFFDTFFNIRSSSNIINKFKLSLRIAPPIAIFSFFLIGVIKSIFIAIKNVNR